MGRTEGKNGSFLAIKMKIHHFPPCPPCGLEKTPQREAGDYAQIYDCYVHIYGIFATVTVLRGTHWVP